MTFTPGAASTTPDSPLDRRFLLGGLAGVATAVVASRAGAGGPLNPPAGSVGSTGRTLDEIYNRVGSTGELRSVIPGGSGVYFISTPGSYVLGGNRSGTGSVITVLANDVTLDLNGFTLTTSSTTDACLTVTNGADRVYVHNGTTVGGFYGVHMGEGVGVRLADLSVFHAIRIGIYGSGNGASSILQMVDRCTVVQTGLNSLASDPAEVSGIRISGKCCHIRGCTVLNTMANGTGTVWGIYSGGYGSVVSDCTVANPINEGAAYGISANVNGLFINNRVLFYDIPYGAGSDGGNWP